VFEKSTNPGFFQPDKDVAMRACGFRRRIFSLTVGESEVSHYTGLGITPEHVIEHAHECWRAALAVAWEEERDGRRKPGTFAADHPHQVVWEGNKVWSFAKSD